MTVNDQQNPSPKIPIDVGDIVFHTRPPQLKGYIVAIYESWEMVPPQVFVADPNKQYQAKVDFMERNKHTYDEKDVHRLWIHSVCDNALILAPISHFDAGMKTPDNAFYRRLSGNPETAQTYSIHINPKPSRTSMPFLVYRHTRHSPSPLAVRKGNNDMSLGEIFQAFIKGEFLKGMGAGLTAIEIGSLFQQLHITPIPPEHRDSIEFVPVIEARMKRLTSDLLGVLAHNFIKINGVYFYLQEVLESQEGIVPLVINTSITD